MGLVVLLRPGPERLIFQGWGAGPHTEEPGPEPIQALLVADSDAAPLPSTPLIIAI